MQDNHDDLFSTLAGMMDAAAEAAAEAEAQRTAQQEDGAPPQPPEMPQVVAILPTRGMLVYPMSALPLRVAQPRSLKLVDDALLQRTQIGLVAAQSTEKEEPGPDDIYRYGTLGAIVRHFKKR